MKNTVQPTAPERLLTVEDLEAPRTPYRDCELWDGHAVVRDPSGGESEVVAAHVVGPLIVHVAALKAGWVTLSQQGFILARHPDLMLAADSAFTSYARLPVCPKRGFWRCAPDFALEARSAEDSWPKVLAKAETWVHHGVRVVWAADPETRTVVVLRPGEPPRTYGVGEQVDAAPALPEFRLAVADIFSGLA